MRDILEAWKRGWSQAEKKVVMGDGADWIWNLAGQYFPGAIHIVDLYHARQHLWDVARKLHPNDESTQNRWIMTHQDLLDNCAIKRLVSALRSHLLPPNWQRNSAPKQRTFAEMLGACATQSSVASTYSWVPASLKQAARP